MFLIFGILFLLFGIVMLLMPHLFYDLVEGWKNNAAGEPSALYIFSTRFGGAVITIVGILSIIAFFYCR